MRVGAVGQPGSVEVSAGFARQFYLTYVSPHERAPEGMGALLGPCAVVVAVAGRRLELGNGGQVRVEVGDLEDLVRTAKLWPVWLQQVEAAEGGLRLRFLSGVARYDVAGTVERVPTSSQERA